MYCGDTSTILVNKFSFKATIFKQKYSVSSEMKKVTLMRLLTRLVCSCRALKLVKHITIRNFKLSFQTRCIYRNQVRLDIFSTGQGSTHRVVLFMNVDSWLISCIAVCDHCWLMLVSLVPIITHWQRERIWKVILHDICFPLIEEFDALLCMAQEHILGVDDYLCSSLWSVNLGCDSELSSHVVAEYNLFFIIHLLICLVQFKAFWGEMLVIQVE